MTRFALTWRGGRTGGQGASKDNSLLFLCGYLLHCWRISAAGFGRVSTSAGFAVLDDGLNPILQTIVVEDCERIIAYPSVTEIVPGPLDGNICFTPADADQ